MRCDPGRYMDCWTEGNHWSIASPLLGFSMLLMSVQALMLALGVWVLPTRVIGLWCQTLCSCNFFGSLITVTIYRFNPKGSLAALSQAGASYKIEDNVAIMTDEVTYADDGKMILNLWITSLVFLVAQCLLACYAAAPPT